MTDLIPNSYARCTVLIGSLGKVDKAIVLLWLEDCSYDQIADIVGMTRANVASRLHRIKQRLRKQTE